MRNERQIVVQDISPEKVRGRILAICVAQVMLDRDLAELYGVPVKCLNEQVSRNIERFPSGFMFQLSASEFADLKSEIATSSWGGIRNALKVFTEQGVAMLSAVLNSPTAILVSIAIMEAFVRTRRD
jgi:hypothetical protein